MTSVMGGVPSDKELEIMIRCLIVRGGDNGHMDQVDRTRSAVWDRRLVLGKQDRVPENIESIAKAALVKVQAAAEGGLLGGGHLNRLLQHAINMYDLSHAQQVPNNFCF